MKFIHEVPSDRDIFEKYEYGSSRGFWPADASFYYSVGVLKTCLFQYPLTMENINHVLGRSKVQFDIYGSRCFPAHEPMHWNIFVDEQIRQEEQAQHLLHEVVHVYYRIHVFGWMPRVDTKGCLTVDGEIEKMIDDTANEFYDVNKKTIDEIVTRLRGNSNLV